MQLLQKSPAGLRVQNPHWSWQDEKKLPYFDGVENSRSILGEPQGKIRYNARFLYFGNQQTSLMSLAEFIHHVLAKQQH